MMARSTSIAPGLIALFLVASASGCGFFGGGGAKPSAEIPVEQSTDVEQIAQAEPESMLDLQQQSEWAPAEPYWPYRMAEAHLSAGDPIEAETQLRAALERDSFYPPALSLLSQIYFDTGRHQQAIDMLEAARAEPERFAGGVPQALLEGLALHYDTIDEVERAEEILALIPGGQNARSSSPAVYLLLRSDKPGQADELAVAALKKNDKSAVNQNNYGITRLRAGDPTGAREAFLRAIKIDPSLPGPYYNMAILEKYYAFNDEKAEGWFRQYQERSTEDPDGLYGEFEGELSESLSKGTE